MANQLKMAQVQAIIELHRRGWSQRRIAQELGIDRETVARYVRPCSAGESNPAKVPAGPPLIAAVPETGQTRIAPGAPTVAQVPRPPKKRAGARLARHINNCAKNGGSRRLVTLR
jgi:transposase